jgi:small neutral amino acid transporter SnatA (MarC family)
MNKTQRIIVVVGLLVLAVVLCFSFCDYVTCALLGIDCPIVLIVGGVLLIVGMDKSKPEHTETELPGK